MPALDYAKQLMGFYSANPEIVELDILLHAIDRFKFRPTNHDLTGLPETKKFHPSRLLP